MLITMSITVEEANEVEARRVAAALAAALAPAKPEAKPAEAPKAAKPEAKPAEAPNAEDGSTEEQLLDQAALHAVALMQAGMTGSVREALTAVGARRVSQIQGVEALQKFISLLPEVPASEDA